MTNVEKIVVIAAVVVVLGAVLLRLRKLRRDEMRKIAARVDRRLMVPPPSPYAPSKGFRLLDGPVNDQGHHEPPRPRLEPDREYVFSESQLPSYGETVSPAGRHDERWALSKSVRPSRFSSLGVRLIVLVVVLAVMAVVTLYFLQPGAKTKPPATTTTTTAKTSNVNVVWPTTLGPSSTNGQDATYWVPASNYRVTVSGTKGPVWTVFTMGPQNTLEWQGKIAVGASESLIMRGVSHVSLGAPKSATVRVGQSSVAFPASLPPTLTLVFTPAVTSPD
jgi:hypothetical protein